jgi:propanol-preferring alcohol dehydrogenase
MRALRLTAWQHDPEIEEVPDPTPGPGEVLVRVGGAGACHSDLHLLHDFPAGLLPFDAPFTLGHENAGWVEAVGVGVTGLETGQPVAVYGAWGCGRCSRCLQGMDNYCENRTEFVREGGGLGSDGGMAPLLLVPSARHVVPLDRLDPVDAAPLTDAGLTPYHAIKRSLHRLVPGSTALVIGAGGLGHMAIQILAAVSATRIVAVDQSAEALELARTVGAAHTVLAGPSATAEIRDLTKNQGTDLVLDLVGADSTIALAVSVARRLSDVTIVGIGGGSFAFSFFTVPYEVSLATTYWGSLSELREVLALAEAGKVRAHVERFTLDDAPKAYQRMAEGTLRGRAVIVP